MLVLKQMENDIKLEHLQCTFPKLTEENQQYVLGLAEGLKHAQGKTVKQQNKNDVDLNKKEAFKNVM